MPMVEAGATLSDLQAEWRTWIRYRLLQSCWCCCAALALSIICCSGDRSPQRPVSNARRSEIEQDFARVFSMTSPQGREGLITRWMDRSGCDRTEAMRLATEEWRRDNR
jgi:hypothetical protein